MFGWLTYGKILRVLALTFVASMFASTVANADWYAAYTGGGNHGGDAYGAAAEQFFHFYGTLPGISLDGTCGITNSAAGHPIDSCVYGHATAQPLLHGYGSNKCATGTFQTVMSCSSGPAGYQGGGGGGTCPLLGDPLNVMSGEGFEEATDFTTAGSEPLTLKRYYNSDTTFVISRQAAFSSVIGAYQSRFGIAWRSEFDRFIVASSALSSTTADVDATRADGMPIHFKKVSGVWYRAYWNPSTQGWSASTDPRHDIDLKFSTDGTNWFITDQNDNVETYDGTGKLTSIAYRGGYSLTFTYDTSGHNTVITDVFGRTLTFTYLSNGLVDTVTDPTTGVTHYSYVDRSGVGSPSSGGQGDWVLQKVTYPDGKFLTYLYEDTHAINRYALTGITDENGNRYATWAYDSTTGRATSGQHAGGADLTTISYNDTANTRTVTNPLSKQAIYSLATYQGVFRISSIAGQASTHCPAGTTSYSYDSNGFVSQTTSEEGRVNTYVHNSIGEETSRTEGYGTSVARTITTTWNSTWHEPNEIVEPNLTMDFTYDTSGRPTQLTLTDTTTQSIPYSTNGQTRTWTYTYTTGGLLHTVDGPLSGTGDTTTYAYNSSGFVNSITDVLGHVTSITSINGRGQPLTSVDPNSITTNYTYDTRGRILTVTVNPGTSQAQTGFTYDDAGNLTVITLPDSSTLTYAYDNAHRLTSVTNNLGETITYTLDAMGDRTATVVKSASATITKQQSATFDELGRVLNEIGAASQTTAHAYDRDNNKTSTTDPRSKVYGYAFDALNRLYQETDPDSYQTTIAYNGKDEVTSVTDARSLVTSYVRDGFGDVIRQTSPDTGITDFWYDANGKITKQIDARSIETDFTNDVAGRVTAKTFPAASAENVAYTYDSTSGGNDGVGRLTSLTDQSGSTAFVYDALGHVSSDTRVIGSNSYGTAYTYDTAGNILTETYPSGRIVTYTRDALGRISGITTKQNSGSSAVTVASSVGYEPFGPLTGLTFGNGLVATLTWDQDYQLTGIGTTDGTITVQSLTNGYDASGNITSITDALASSRSQTLTYDDLNRLHTASGLYGSHSYTYDGVGNRLTRVIGSTTDTYAYSSSANRISTVTTGSNVRSFTYLASGQVSQDVRDASNTYTFAANDNGRNASASLNGSTAGTYLYNAFEQRVQKTVGSTTTQFVFDRFGHLLEEADGSGTVQKEYIWLDDLPVAVVDDTGASPVLYFIHTDQLGTPQKITDGTASIVWDGALDPFGNPASVTGSLTNNLRFRGQYFDIETALNQNWHRDYDSTIGRYIQSDSIGLDSGDVNTYEYVWGNPGGLTDHKGECVPCYALLIIAFGTAEVVNLDYLSHPEPLPAPPPHRPFAPPGVCTVENPSGRPVPQFYFTNITPVNPRALTPRVTDPIELPEPIDLNPPTRAPTDVPY